MRNGACIVKTTEVRASRQQRRRDRAHRRAERALEIALHQHCCGTFSALSWCAAGMPDCVGPEELELYQSARQIVHANSGCLKAGDVERLLAEIQRRREAS